MPRRPLTQRREIPPGKPGGISYAGKALEEKNHRSGSAGFLTDCFLRSGVHKFIINLNLLIRGDSMALDMKESIAQAVKTLVMEKGVRRLTVKEIVDECHITRQAFYYHFEDIPGLIQWMLQRETERTMLEAQALEDGESRLRYLFSMAVPILPYVRKGMESNFGDELERLLEQNVQALFARACDEEGLYQNCTRFESGVILRYHSQAILGLLRGWTEKDTEHLDEIVRITYRLMTEGIPPRQEHKIP